MTKLKLRRAGVMSALVLTFAYASWGQNIEVSPKLIQFPNQGIGTTSSSYTITLTNNQSGSLNISSIGISAPFAETNNCGTMMTADQQCTIKVTFSPTAKQYYSSTMTITDSATNSPQTVSLTGNGVVALAITPKQILFPNQGIGTTSSDYSFTVTNNSSSAFSISSIATSAPFSETNNCGSSLAAGANCTVEVKFAPTTVKYYSSDVTVTAAGSTQEVEVTGNGVRQLTISPAQILFPNQGVNSTSSAYTFMLTNNQSAALSIKSIATPAPFAQTNNCGSSLAAGAACTVSVTFSPTTVKYFASDVTITDNAGNSPQQIPVTGNGIQPVKFTPLVGGFYFNHQITGTASTPQAISITNEQNTPLTFTSITGPANFPFTTNCGNGSGSGTLAANSSCTVQVSFLPPSTQAYSGNVVISENASGSPITIPVQGTGISGSLGPMVVVTPPASCLLPGQSTQFTANFVDASSGPVNWYIDGVHNGNTGSGKTTASGLYTAPSGAGLYTIRAVDQANTSLGGNATITVSDTITYSMYPNTAYIPTGTQQSFQAQQCGVPDAAVTYEVDGVTGGNSSVGTINSSGLYTAPSAAGSHSIKAIDSKIGRSATGRVTVISAITADFASRAKNTTYVPANMLGYGRGESLTSEAQRALLTQGGLTETRLNPEIMLVYKTETPDWNQVDSYIEQVKASGQHALLQMKQSPPWLEPTSGSCKYNNIAAPTNVTEWANMAVAYVAHMDHEFPGVVTAYEIWNEPNTSGMCAANHLDSYMAIYAAAAPAMKAQAKKDGQTIRVGGPVTSGYNGEWMNALLTNSTTAPYVDFVSYHQYFYGQTALFPAWDTYNGYDSIYEAMQSPTTGVFDRYQLTYDRVVAGSQPLGAKTPIYVTEFNVNWAFFQDCCRNDPTYAPVFNALYITDMLDVPYSGVPEIPAQLDYFAGSAYPYFCIIGVQDSNNDCLASVGANLVPYPQYYAFQLIGSPSYLGLADGGYLARSVSAPASSGGIATAAFYTNEQDSLVIVNPTATSYSQIAVTLQNPGFSNTQGTLYQIENGAQINSSSISFSVSGSSLTTHIDIPPHSVQGITLK